MAARGGKENAAPRRGKAPVPKCVFVVGDRVSVRMDPRTVCAGEVRFVGPSGGRLVVGLRLDDRRPGLGDGKRSSGERHFRCEAGHAIFASPSQCRALPRPPAMAAAAGHPAAAPPPPIAMPVPSPPASSAASAGAAPGAAMALHTPFNLETHLSTIVGLEGVKDTLRSLRNRLVVGRKRQQFGVRDDMARAFVLVGADGAAFEAVAGTLAALLTDLGVLGGTGMVIVARPHDLVRASTATTVAAAETAIDRAATDRGLLLVADAGALVAGDARDGGRGGDHARAALETLVAAGTGKRAATAGFCVAFAVRPAAHATLLRAAPALTAVQPVTFELAEYALPEVAELLRREVVRRGFELAEPSGPAGSWLEALLAPKLARCGPDGGGIALARAAVDDAVRRQTNRVYARGTASRASLLALEPASVHIKLHYSFKTAFSCFSLVLRVKNQMLVFTSSENRHNFICFMSKRGRD